MKDECVFCEPAHPGFISPWHIRKLTDAGLKPHGGIDSASICGRLTPPDGVDLAVPIDARSLALACPRCVEIYRKEHP
jgi:hypothetical protein